MIESDEVPFGWNTANRLMAIADHSILSNSDHDQNLPCSWQTMYELTKAPDENLEIWLADRTIHPELQRKDVLTLLRSLRISTPKGNEMHLLEEENFHLVCGDALEEALKFPTGSVDAIITDPPYGAEFMDCYDKLIEVANHLLRDGGNCLVMTGQANLPSVLHGLAEALNYQWTLSYSTPGASTQVFGRHVKSNWKPVLWLTKNKNENEHINDVVHSDQEDKRFHPWGQSVSGMAQIVERFTSPSSLVCDPFCGAGSTGVAALVLNRVFLGIDIEQSCIEQAAERLTQMP